MRTLFVINDEKIRSLSHRNLRVGPPESSKAVRKCPQNTFSGPIIDKKAQNRPVSDHFLSRFLTAFARSKGKTRGFWTGRLRKVSQNMTESGPLRTGFHPPNKTESNPSSSRQEPSFSVKKTTRFALVQFPENREKHSYRRPHFAVFPLPAGKPTVSVTFRTGKTRKKTAFAGSALSVGRCRSVSRGTVLGVPEDPSEQHRAGTRRGPKGPSPQ